MYSDVDALLNSHLCSLICQHHLTDCRGLFKLCDKLVSYLAETATEDSSTIWGSEVDWLRPPLAAAMGLREIDKKGNFIPLATTSAAQEATRDAMQASEVRYIIPLELLSYN